VAASGCATNAPQMAWGKPGVTRIDYGTEIGMCTGHAAMQGSGGNGAHTAGGINGSNSTASSSPAPSGASISNTAASTGGASTGSRSGPSPGGGGNYSGMATSDYAARAATQQQAQEMAVQRARAAALRGCLTERGYQEFALNAEQRAQLAKLKKGSAEYHEYLYQLGSDAEIVGKQSRAPGQ
jgi:hypothetical protein